MEEMLPFVFMVLLFNPFIFVFLKKPVWALTNFIIVILYVVSWLVAIGRKGTVDFLTIIWVVLLFITICFNFIGLSMLWLKLSTSTKNKYILFGLIVSANFLGLYFYGLERGFFKIIISFLDALVLYIVPIFLTA